MRDIKIEITHFEFTSLKRLEIRREVNEHGSALISGYIHDNKIEEYQKKLLKNIWVSVIAIGENDERTTLMTGVAAEFKLTHESLLSTLTLNIMTSTYLMDGHPHFRTFQNPDAPYIQIFSQINASYENPGIIGLQDIYLPTGDFLMQYKESDWSFVKRVASRMGLNVIPGIARDGLTYLLGTQKRETYTLKSGVPYTSNRHVGTFMQNSSNGQGSLYEGDYIEYEIVEREIYDLWDYLSFDSGGGYVSKIFSEYNGEELVHTYYLRSSNGMRVIRTFNQQQAGCSFEAIVTAVKQDVVQVDVLGDENSGQSVKYWFPYSTVYSSPSGPGWYCMPEIGDYVRLYIPCDREETGYVISAVHKETSADRQNPDHKSFKTKYGKEILMTPSSIVITNNQGMQIELNDGSGINIVSDKDISIQSSGSATVSSESGSLTVAGSSSVELIQGGASINLADDISFGGGKFRIQ